VPIVLKSGSLNLLEPSGPVEACNGIALPLPLPLYYDARIHEHQVGYLLFIGRRPFIGLYDHVIEL